MAKDDGLYVIPSGIDKSVAKVITEQLKDASLADAELHSDVKIDYSVRKSQVHWLNTDHWVSGMMAHFIHTANSAYFHYDLHGWSDRIQYTVYDGPGTNYIWHNDHQPSTFFDGMWRKLSISLCLEDDYEGGQLQLMTYEGKLRTYDMKCGDVVIFSSDIMHRVRPLRSGRRTSLVGWYAGPKFK